MINDFRFEYRFLSNFHVINVEYEGMIYPSTENAFQAAKTLDLEVRKQFQNISPKEAKALGRRVILRSDWNDIRISVMTDVCKSKFSDPSLKARLLATGTAELIEGNWWNDKFWGVCNGVGENNLGKILMKIRDNN